MLRRAFVRLTAFAAVLLLPEVASAAVVTIAWDRNPETNIAGYRISYGTVSGAYTTTVDVGNRLDWQIRGVEDGQKYYFVVRAINTAGAVSPPSTEISANIVGLTALTTDMVAPTPTGKAITWTALAGPVPNSSSVLAILAGDGRLVGRSGLQFIEQLHLDARSGGHVRRPSVGAQDRLHRELRGLAVNRLLQRDQPSDHDRIARSGCGAATASEATSSRGRRGRPEGRRHFSTSSGVTTNARRSGCWKGLQYVEYVFVDAGQPTDIGQHVPAGLGPRRGIVRELRSPTEARAGSRCAMHRCRLDRSLRTSRSRPVPATPSRGTPVAAGPGPLEYSFYLFSQTAIHGRFDPGVLLRRTRGRLRQRPATTGCRCGYAGRVRLRLTMHSRDTDVFQIANGVPSFAR